MSIQDHHRRSSSISLSSHMGLDMPSLEQPMSSNENPPQLALSDIMHHMSPSPVPAEDSTTAEDSDPYPNGSRRDIGGSPEPLTVTDIVAMRRRLHALGFSLDRAQNELNIGEDLTRHSDDFGGATLRERELVNMILQLTDPLPVDSTQLERQADSISVLTSQRDFLVRQAEEDRDRWRSEREGWDRMAEALLSGRNRTGKSATREDETERQKVQLESENRALRDKLQDTQNRLSSLESELMKLKPLLLMQPYSVAHLRQNLASQPQVVSQPLNTVLGTGYGPPEVRPNRPTSDVKGKRRDSDSASSRTQLEAIPEDLGTSGLGHSSLARSSSHPGGLAPSASMPLFSGASNSTADIYRRPEPPSQYSYPYNYHYSIPPSSSSKSTPIPPKITVKSLSSSSTHHSQPQHYTTAGSTSKTLGSTAHQNFPTTPSQSHPSPTVSPQRRRSRDYVNHPAGTTYNVPIRRSNHGIAPLTSDARIEHVLLAARRIGRERAGLVSGILQHVEREREIHARDLELTKARQDLERSERERLERLANGTSGLAYYRSTDVLTSPQRNTGRGSASVGVPRTPKRGGGVGVTYYPSLSNSPISSPTHVPTSAGPSTFIFVNTSAAGTSGYSGGGVMNTPSRRSVLKSGGTARGSSRNLPSNPPTPLDSLLDAARMIDDGAGGKAKTNGTRKALEHPESPVPKRRKISSSGSKTVGRGGGMAGASIGGKVARVKSALDVLADQAAAAFDEPGQTTRGSNSGGKGKEKRKVGDEGLGSGGDLGVGNDQECDDVDRQDDLWPQGSTSASTPVSPIGASRGRSRAKTASINMRAIAESTSSSSMSLRPVRQASQKSLASKDLQPPPSISMTTAGGKGKSRGRPKGSKSRPRSDVSIESSSTSRMNPSLGPRVIASVSTYSPLDVAIALQPQKDRRREKGKERERSGEHSQWATANNSPGMGSLRPVVEWGKKGADEGEDVEGEGEGGYVPLVVAGGGELGLGQQNDHVERIPDADGSIAVEADNNDKATNEAESVSTLKIVVRDMEKEAETQINTLGNAPTNGHISPADVDLPPVDDANAEADLDDEDAEGEQEEEEEDDENVDAETGQDRSSRSRTPPPPDPPHSGAPSDSNDNDPDPDADAEGEMEIEENEELPPKSTTSAVNQTALSVVMGQVSPGNFDGSFLDDDVWLIKVFWMVSFGYNTASTHVLISAMVPEIFTSSLSVLSDLSDKMSLHLPYSEQGPKSVVGSLEGWWRSIDVKGEKENLSLVI